MDDGQNEIAAQAVAQRIDAVLASDRAFAALQDGLLDTAELRTRTHAVGHALLTNIAPKAVVGILSASDRHVIAAVTACLRLGHPFLICDPDAPADDTTRVLNYAGATGLLCSGPLASSFDQIPDLCVLDAGLSQGGTADLPNLVSTETAILVATSGTTDRPKIVDLSHANLVAQYAIFADVYGFDADTCALNPLPLHHVDGLIRGPLLALWFNATLLRRHRFSVDQAPAILNDLIAQNATHLITVPAMLRILHRAQDSETYQVSPSLQFILCSADYLDAKLWQAVEADFKVPVVNAYGLSEVVCDALIAGPDDATRVPGTIGIARGLDAVVLDSTGQAVADGDIGELAIRSDTVMRGYMNDPVSTAAVVKDGLLRTGDLVSRRQDGLFDYKGRKKNVVVVGGVTIHPEAVSEVLTSLPNVAEAFVFGNQTDTGEVLIAAICPTPGAGLDPDVIHAACRTHLAPERRPSKIVVLPELPRRASGKVDQTAIVAAATTKNSGASVQDIAAECFRVPVDDLSTQSTPFDTTGWDSLAHMEFIELLEERFDFTMSPLDVAGLMSIADAIEIVERETAQ